MPIIYLAGPINGCNDEEAKGWRDQVKYLLPFCDFFDPVYRDFRSMPLTPAIAKRLVEEDLQELQKCNVLLVYHPHPSSGTDMELFYVSQVLNIIYDYWIPVVVILPPGAPCSPWVQYCAGVIVPSLVEAVKWIQENCC